MHEEKKTVALSDIKFLRNWQNIVGDKVAVRALDKV
jgi:hypothetical protein